jgi:hypothetical protein
MDLSCVFFVFSDRVEDATEAKTRHDNKVATGCRRQSGCDSICRKLGWQAGGMVMLGMTA